jgi:hypothetical protein
MAAFLSVRHARGAGGTRLRLEQDVAAKLPPAGILRTQLAFSDSPQRRLSD